MRAVVAAVVFMVIDVVTGCVPEIVAACAAEHVGESVAPDGPEVIAQLRATLPVKPPLGVIVTVDVPVIPGDVMVTAVPLKVNAAGVVDPATVIATAAVSLLAPEVPVRVAE